ncbi:tetratricopeptide repeat protein [Rubritalea tangerina]|uniref:Tetratricopeptide repeat protein n=1 Tax=Rubritalea tangerina TaxID=430798 RepID=A0ABW4ZAS2_9BACT
MKPFYSPLVFSLALSTLSAEITPGDKALKYHKALQSRPLNEQLFDRFYGAWMEEQELDALGAYLTEKTQKSWQDWTLLARYQMRRSLDQEAITSLGHAIANSPNPSPLHQLRAELHFRNLNFAEAINDLKEIKLDDAESSIETTRLLGTCYLRVGKVDEALALWSEAIKSSDVGIDFVDAAATEGAYEKAIELCQTLISKTKDPYEKVRFQIRLAELQGQANQIPAALESLKTTLNDTGNASWLESEILRKADSIFDRQGDLTGQITFYRELHSSQKHRTNIKQRYAFLLASNDEWDKAESLFAELLQSAPDALQLRKDFIVLLTNSEKFDRALKELDLLIQQQGESEPLLLQRIGLLHQLDRKDEIKPLIQKIEKLVGSAESDQIRVSQIYLQNGLKAEAETLLLNLSQQDSALLSREALASFYIQNEQKQKAIDILTKATRGADIESLIRITTNIATAGAPEKAYSICLNRKNDFASDPRYLHTLCQLAISSNNDEQALPFGEDLIHLAQRPQELDDAIKMAFKLIQRTESNQRYIEKLESASELSTQDKCLLAQLYASDNQIDKARSTLTQSPDPLSTYFWAGLLVKHKLEDEACAVLLKLIDSPSGRNTVFLRKLCQLQKSIGDTDAALDTIAKWKEIAPNDKVVWIWESDLLQNNGETGKAIANLRRAIARFEKADDLHSLLSKSYLHAGMYQDAHEVLWDSFEKAKTVESKMHWSRELVKLNYDLARLNELKNEFLKRRSGNKKAISPVLALIQVAIKEQDLDAEREYTKEALALQPNNEKLLLNIGDIEERLGNSDTAETYYRQASEITGAKNAQNQLLKFYFRSGQEDKAFALVKAQNQSSDPRKAEQLAVEMFRIGYLDAALISLKTLVAKHPNDWRAKYLYATLLEENGQLDEASELFINLSSASGELPDIEADSYPVRSPWSSSYYPEVLTLSDTIYQFRNNLENSRHSGWNANNPFIKLPSSPDEAQKYSHTHLFTIMSSIGASPLHDSIHNHLIKEKVPEVDVLAELFYLNKLHANSRWGGHSIDYKKLIKKFPDSPLLILADMQSFQSLELEDGIRLLKTSKDNPDIEYYAASLLLTKESSDEQFDQALSRANALLSQNHKCPPSVFSKLCSQYSQPDEHLTDERKKALLTLITQCYDNNLLKEHNSPYQSSHQRSLAALIFASLGDEKRLLEFFNHPDFTDTLKGKKKSSAFAYYTSRNDYSFLLYQDASYLNQASKINLGIFTKELFLNDDLYPNLDKDTIKSTLEKSLPRVESKTIAAELYTALNDSKKAQDKLREAIASNTYESPIAVNTLAYQLEQDEQYLESLELYIKSRKSADTKFAKAATDARIIQVAQKCDKADLAGKTKILTTALTTFHNSPGNSYVAQRTQLAAAQLDIKLPRKKLNQKTQEKRETILRNITGISYDKLHQRFTPLTKSGKQDQAARLAARLFIHKIHSHYPANGMDDLINGIQSNKLDDLFLNHLKTYTTSSSIWNDTYCVALHLLGRESEVPNTIESLKDPRANKEWKALRTALSLHKDKPEEALKVLTTSIPNKDVSVSIPTQTKVSPDQWYLWASLVADYAEHLEKTPETERELMWLVPILSDLAESKHFNNNNYIQSVFEQDNDRKEKNKKRVAAVTSISRALLKNQQGAEAGYMILNLLESAGKISPNSEFEWMHTALKADIFSSAKSTEEVSPFSLHNIRHNYARGKASNLQEELCKKLKSHGANAVLPPSLIKELKKSAPDTEQALSDLIKLSKLRGEKFQNQKDTLSKSWKQSKTTALYELANNLNNLAPYTKERVDKEFAEILPKLKKVGNSGYRDRQEQIKAATDILSNSFHDISKDFAALKYKEMLETILGDRSEWPKRSGKQNSSNSVEYTCRTISQALAENPELLSMMLKASWIHELPINNHSYDARRMLTERTYKDTESCIAFLERLGLVADAKDYFPLTTRASGWQSFYTVESIEAPLKDLDHYIHKNKKHWNAVIEALKENKEKRFGSLLTAASLTSSDRDKTALVNQAFEECADELTNLPDAQLSAIYTNFEDVMPNTDSWKHPKLIAIGKKLAAQNAKEALTAMETMAQEIKDGKTFSSSNRNLYQTERRAADFARKSLTAYPEKTLDFVKAYIHGHAESLKNGGQYSRYSSSSGALYASKDQLLETIIYRWKENKQPSNKIFEFISHIHADESISEHVLWTPSAYSSLEDCIEIERRKLQNATTDTKQKKDWVYLDKMAQDFSQMSPEAQSIATVALLHEFYNNGSWNIKADHPLVTEWTTKAADTPIYQTLQLIAESKCKGAKKDPSTKNTLLLAHLNDAHAPTDFRIMLAAKALTYDSKLILNEDFNQAVIKLQQNHLNGKRSARTDIQERLLEAYTRAHKKQNNAAACKAVLDTWLEKVKRPLRGEQKQVYNDLSTAALNISVAGSHHNAINWLISNSADGLRGDIPAILALLKENQFDVAKRLLPLPGKFYRHWNGGSNHQYDAQLEAILPKFKTALDDERAFFRFECELLYLEPKLDKQKASEGQITRTARLSKQLTQLNSLTKETRVEALASLCQAHTGISLNAEPIKNEIGRKTYAFLLNEHAKRSGDRYKKWLVDLYHFHAIHEMKQGNLKPLESIVELYEKDQGDHSNLHYYANNAQDELSHSMCFALVESVRKQSPHQLETLLPLLKRLVLVTFEKDNTDNRSRTSPLAYAKLVSHKLNKRPELDTWGKKLSPEGQKAYKKVLELANLPVYISWPVENEDYWLEDDNKAYRMDLFTWLYANPESAESMQYKLLWAANNMAGRGLTEAEVFELTSAESTHPNAKKSMLVHRAWHFYEKKDYDKALADYHAAMELMQDGDKRWDSLFDDASVYAAEIYLLQENKDKAIEIAKKLRLKGIDPKAKNRRNTLLKKLDLLEQPKS